MFFLTLLSCSAYSASSASIDTDDQHNHAQVGSKGVVRTSIENVNVAKVDLFRLDKAGTLPQLPRDKHNDVEEAHAVGAVVLRSAKNASHR